MSEAAPRKLYACTNNDQSDLKTAMYTCKARVHSGFDENYFDVLPGISRTIKINTQLLQEELRTNI